MGLFSRNDSIIFKIVVTLLVFFFHTPQGYTDDRKLVSLATEEWEPYIGVDTQGHAHGLYYELLHEIIVSELDLKLAVNFYPWKRAQYNVKNGLDDMMLTFATKERLSYALRCEHPLLHIYLNVYTYKDHPRIEAIAGIKTVEDIKTLGLIPVSILGNGWHKDKIDRLGIKTQYVHSEDSTFDFLAARRADITIEPNFSGSYILQKKQLNDKIVAMDVHFGPMVVDLLVSKKSFLASKILELNKAMAAIINDGRYQAIINKYK